MTCFHRPTLVATLVLGLALAGLAKGEVALPLERTSYLVGEVIPLAATGGRAVEIVDEDGVVAARGVSEGAVLKLDTSVMAPGNYRIHVDGEPTDTRLTLVHPIRDTMAANIEEVNLAYRVHPANQEPDEDLEARLDYIRNGFEYLGINVATQNAFFGFQFPGFPQDRSLDLILPYRSISLINPTNRMLSFKPIHVFDPNLPDYHQRLAHVTQANLRYPNFSGFSYDWDPTSFTDLKGITFYFNEGELQDEFALYSDRRDAALFDALAEATGGLTPPDKLEFNLLQLWRGFPEGMDILDYPEYRRFAQLVESSEAISDEEAARISERAHAWADFLRRTQQQTYQSHQSYLQDVEPTLANSSSLQVDHLAQRFGRWQPTGYEPLDFRYMSTWNEAEGLPNYSYQWLLTAALLEVGRQETQPVWLAMSTGMGHDPGDRYPGGYVIKAAHILPYGGRATGTPTESHLNLMFPLRPKRPGTWDYTKISGTAKEAEYRSGRDFMNRFAPLADQTRDVRRVAVLMSESAANLYPRPEPFKPRFHTLIALMRLGYTPRLVTEAQIAAGHLDDYGALVVVNQWTDLPPKVGHVIDRFLADGAKVVLDEASTINIDGATRVSIDLPYARRGVPHNWSAPVGSNSTSRQVEVRRLMPILYQALGDELRAPLISKKTPDNGVSSLELDGGDDAQYVIATPDGFVTWPYWRATTETLHPNGISGDGVIYDLTAEQRIGPVEPVTCELSDMSARVFGILARPVEKIDLRATQRIGADQEVGFSVAFTDRDGKPLRAAIPFEATLKRPDGSVLRSLYRATDREGRFGVSLALGSTNPTGEWSLTVRSQLDGMTATLPIEVAASEPVTIASDTSPALVRGKDAIDRLLDETSELVIPVFEGPHHAERLAAAHRLRDRLGGEGLEVIVMDTPVIETFWYMLEPTQQTDRQNERIEAGLAIGKIDSDHRQFGKIKVSNYFNAISGYRFGKPMLLLSIADEDANPLVQQLGETGMLWPTVTPSFPGEGRAVVQGIHAAFHPQHDSIVVTASDASGLDAAIEALADLPEDWIGTSVSQARRNLLAQFHVTALPKRTVDEASLSAEGLKTAVDPQPMRLKFFGTEPPAVGEAHAPLGSKHQGEHAYRSLPFVIAAGETADEKKSMRQALSKLPAYYRVDDAWIEIPHPLPGDLRFMDALGVPVEIPEADRYEIQLDGLFRYSDRKPATQATWEPIHTKWWGLVEKKRLPMKIAVFAGDEQVGVLTDAAIQQTEVPTFYGWAGPEATVTEEAATSIRGTVELPEGEYVLRLQPLHITDPRINGIRISNRNEP